MTASRYKISPKNDENILKVDEMEVQLKQLYKKITKLNN